MMYVVYGNECLEYIQKPIGVACTNNNWSSIQDFVNDNDAERYYSSIVKRDSVDTDYMKGVFCAPIKLCKWDYDVSKRIVGVVQRQYDDGGLYVKVIGNNVNFSPRHNVHTYDQTTFTSLNMEYEIDPILPTWTAKRNDYLYFPTYVMTPVVRTDNYGCVYETGLYTHQGLISFDDVIEWDPLESINNIDGTQTSLKPMIDFDGQTWIWTDDITVTNNINNCMVIGRGVENTPTKFAGWLLNEPLYALGGNLYELILSWARKFASVCPASFEDGTSFYNYEFVFGQFVNSFNFSTIPFNLILTYSEEYAQEYLANGTLPPDAHLYTLDWNNLPKYESDDVPTSDTPEDYPDDNDPDDDDRDFDPMPPETPTYTANQLTNYNWYWLDVSQWAGFINWFWHDVGNYSDFDDIIAKVKGLYNDLASSVIMCRYYPVDVSLIGGTGTPKNIKLGMIEKAGAVDTLANTPLRVQDIGYKHIPNKYKSFMDMSPYSQLSLYLPWHGYIDLDINLFSGHDVYVKALYDYLSGTIQYYIYYDNEVLVNTILCKMAMDIPITLQTKNDRDSAIFNNVSSTIGGLVGAGVGIASGNPIGMTLGVTQGVSAFNSSNASAPMRLMGNVGESGAYLAPQHCAIIIRRPTIQPSDGNNQTAVKKGLETWKHNVGMLCGYGYTLSKLANQKNDDGTIGAGFTVCHSPRIDFKNSTPLQTEVDEIYSYLEKGVIL